MPGSKAPRRPTGDLCTRAAGRTTSLDTHGATLHTSAGPCRAAAAAVVVTAVSRSRRAVVGLRQPLTARERHSTAVRAMRRCPRLVPPIEPSAGHPNTAFLALGRHSSLAVPSVPSVLKKEYIGAGEGERRVSDSEEGGSPDRAGQRGHGASQREERRPSSVDTGWTRAGHMVPARSTGAQAPSTGGSSSSSSSSSQQVTARRCCRASAAAHSP